MCVSLLACDAPTEAPSEPQPPDETEASGDPASAGDQTAPADVYATQGELALTPDQFKTSIAWREWITGQPIADAFGADWRADDALLSRLSSSLFDEALLLHDAARWNLSVSDDERAAALAEIPVAAPLVSATQEERDATLSPVDLTWSELQRAADLAVLIDRWNQHRIDSLTEDDLRSAYLARNDRVTLEIALVPNVHPPETIRQIVAERGEQIEAYYADHTNFFLLPRGARLREVAIAGAADDEASRARAQELRDRAAEDGISGVLEEDSISQPITRGNLDAWVPQGQFPPAFDLLPGELSEVVRFSEYWVFFELIEHRGREMRPLDEDVRAQIAHHFAREESPAAEPLAHANGIVVALQQNPENAEAIYRENRILSETTSSFRRTPSGVVPTIGEAPALSDLVFADGVEVGDLIGPVHVSAGIVVARVLSRERVTDEDFQRDREAFTEEFAGYMRDNAWPARVAEYSSGHPRELDLDALRAALAESP